MTIIFWFSVSLIIYSYFGYPIILMILGFPKGLKVSKGEITPTVSLLILAYNEEKVIREKIENSLDLDYPRDRLEIVVGSESTDRTNEIVREYAEKGIVLYSSGEREGKQATIYRLVPLLKGEIVVFSDTNAIYQKDAIRRLVQNFNDLTVGCVCGELKYLNPQGVSIGETEGLYWKYEIFIKKLESKVHSVLGANGSIYAIRKKLYAPISKYRGDDFEIPIKIAQQGYGVIFEPEAVSFEKTSSTTKEEFCRKVRIIAWVWKSTLILIKDSLKPFKGLLIFQLISHKLLRWLVPIFLALLFISNIFLTSYLFYRILLVVQIIFYLLSFWGYIEDQRKNKLNRIINVPYYFSMVNFAAFLGFCKFILGRQGNVWEKARV